jgi:hypothetical protein
LSEHCVRVLGIIGIVHLYALAFGSIAAAVD